jgi:hypothetical protein
MIEPKLAAEPTQNMQPIDPIDPMDRIDPAEPMDRMDPVEAIDKMEPDDPMDNSEPAEPREPLEPAEPPEPGEAVRSAARLRPCVVMLSFSHPSAYTVFTASRSATKTSQMYEASRKTRSQRPKCRRSRGSSSAATTRISAMSTIQFRTSSTPLADAHG